MTTTLTRYLTPLLLVLGSMLVAANWYFTPERSGSWTTALVVLAVMAGIVWGVLTRASTAAAQRAADSIRAGIIAGAVIMVVALSVKLAQALGALDDGDLAQRLTMVVLGAFFMFTGNAIPKTLTPLSAMPCDVARTQALQRFSGWAFVLSGLAFAVTWVVLPLDLATPVSVTFIFAAGLAVMMQAIRLHRVSRSS